MYMTDEDRHAYLLRIEQEGANSYRSGWPMDKRYAYDTPEFNAFEAGWRNALRKVGNHNALPMPSWALDPPPYKPPKFNAYAEARGKAQPDE